MSEWWTYSLSDFLMFSSRSYYRLLELYNAAVWPAHWLALAAGVIVMAGVARPDRHMRVAAALALAATWGWVAWAYHLERYADINTAAPYFAAAFALQALLLCLMAARPVTAVSGRMQQRLALGIVGLAVIAYPALALLRDGGWAQAEVFGIAPDPTVVATLGVLLGWRAHPIAWIVPVAWCAVSGATLMALRIGSAALLPVCAVLAVTAGLVSRYARQRQASV